MPPPAPDHSNLERAISVRCAEAQLQATEYFMCKTIQLYEMIVVRHGLMVVGQPFSGKSSSLKVCPIHGLTFNTKNVARQGRLSSVSCLCFEAAACGAVHCWQGFLHSPVQLCLETTTASMSTRKEVGEFNMRLICIGTVFCVRVCVGAGRCSDGPQGGWL